MALTKGEAMITGIEKLQEGLEEISRLGSGQDLMRLLVSSPASAKRLRELMRDNYLFRNLIVSMVAAKNSRLVAATVEGVVLDFLDVLFDLSQPYKSDETDGDSDVE